MRAILIDPFAREVREVQIGEGLQPIYDQIKADCFTVVGLGLGEGLFLDDEGLFRSKQEYFALGGTGTPVLAGRGLILGSDSEGESVDSRLDVERVRALVRWLSAAEAVAMNDAVIADAEEQAKEREREGVFVILSMPRLVIDGTTGKAIAY